MRNYRCKKLLKGKFKTKVNHMSTTSVYTFFKLSNSYCIWVNSYGLYAYTMNGNEKHFEKLLMK